MKAKGAAFFRRDEPPAAPPKEQARTPDAHSCGIAGCERPAVFGFRAPGLEAMREPTTVWRCRDHVLTTSSVA
jgi:hypothetical protein